LQLAGWADGRTGDPIVDAGRRELWYSGFMHNRIRMIAGSFLIKDPRQAGRPDRFIRKLWLAPADLPARGALAPLKRKAA